MRQLLVGLLLAVSPLAGVSFYNFQWDTSALQSTNSKYYLDFVLIGDARNQVEAQNINYGQGGSGPDVIILVDTLSQFFNEALLEFTPGSTLSFLLAVTDLTSTVPDTLSLYLLDANQNLLGTTDAFASAILTFDLNPVAIATYAGANPLEFAAPSLTLLPATGGIPGGPGGGGAAIPEPSSLSLTLGATALWCLLSKRRA